jgi:hypothetical protein
VCLLGGEVDQRVEDVPIVDFVVAGEAQHLRRDELLHVPEEVGIGAYLDVREAQPVFGGKAGRAVGARQARRKPASPLSKVWLPRTSSIRQLILYEFRRHSPYE